MGSEYKGASIGSSDNICCFSFQCVKIVTCGDGGAITCSSEEIYKNLKRRVWYGFDRERKVTDFLDPNIDEPDELGFKMNMNDITATLACVAMDELDYALSERRKIGEQYIKAFKNHEYIELMNYKDDRKANFQIFPIHVQNRTKFAKFMWEKGIQVNVNNRRNDIYKMFGGIDNSLTNLAKAEEDVILLPLHLDLSEDDKNKIIDCVLSYKA